MSDDATEPQDAATPAQLSSMWQIQLAMAESDHKDYHDNGKQVYERFKNERKANATSKGKRFNILYSNTEVLRAALYGKAAKPDVRRRFSDQDPTGRQAAQVIERGLAYCAETYDVDKPIESAVLDYLLPGRGVVRVDYEPEFDEQPVIDPMTGQPAMDGEEPKTERVIANQKLRERYVYWKDYLQSPARSWDGVWWVAFRHTMTREELRENDFEDAEEIPLNWEPTLDSKRDTPDSLKKADVWEIWDKNKRQRVWIVKGWPKALRTDDDPYGLEDFYPLPEPVSGYIATDTMIPQPEFFAYQDQAEDLDEITRRISVLTKAMKRRGVYDQSVKELARLANAADNQFIPVENYAKLAEKGGLTAAFQTEDVTVIAKVLLELYKQRDMLVQAIYELTGISDIVRGSSDPNETLGAQQMKAQFGSQRLKRRQRAIQKWIRDIYKIKAEIIAEHFQQNVLQDMTGMQIGPEVMQLLRSDKLRAYRIDIETDSTIFEDAQTEQKSRTDLVTAITGFIQTWGPVIQQQPAMLPMAFELLQFALRGFKAGRALEDTIEQTKNQLIQMAQQAAQQPKPDPEADKIKAEMQMDQEKHQADMQGKQMDQQTKVIDIHAHQQKAQADTAKIAMQLQADRERAAMPAPERVQ